MNGSSYSKPLIVLVSQNRKAQEREVVIGLGSVTMFLDSRPKRLYHLTSGQILALSHDP